MRNHIENCTIVQVSNKWGKVLLDYDAFWNERISAQLKWYLFNESIASAIIYFRRENRENAASKTLVRNWINPNLVINLWENKFPLEISSHEDLIHHYAKNLTSIQQKYATLI